ncbi:protein serine/threonine phosphatases [Leptolyngbya boryana NIES-2135]|jgi:serine/threonine protein phosphatase PrpC|uniref:Protein serine/threonine phosphatases n=1 Tax=Leptolyngbya boryana NIES-2135 TaxID=1973484 RepID=A0A1Z4JCG4_LEPBY|nr:MULTISPECIES: protein phosphatase 2C domain-containing protein [Leptolyngbya]BAY54157.1 protein serine/threonine phosphatases [Leptolyngbya boryana NIES-2135]MBD2371010.1 serine/threonine-protein phosphatase [Leptolyngbya sp. FACHB-161]MBD2377532.1 serine/threonine-protein phosphatase [Leptolyngbya sp. FACHB-238]MBD2401940.1 serine/threonine-protein phosphatase [Leptolyngbya sp. FACHB-239]MBD2408458.1 serine/threonine-protein phosphatase [Leptolyngbya sp. FACHB-402]
MNTLTDALCIQPTARFEIEAFQVQVEAYLAHAADVYYFRVGIQETVESDVKQGLLRVGSINGNLARELQLRQVIETNKLISELAASEMKPAVLISTAEPIPTVEAPPEIEPAPSETISCSICGFENPKESLQCSACGFEFQSSVESIDHPPEPDSTAIHIADHSESTDREDSTASHSHPFDPVDESGYLLDDAIVEAASEHPEPKLLLLSYLPEDAETLEEWLDRDVSLEEALLVATQVCQLFLNTQQVQWSFIQILPKFIYLRAPIQFHDLTGAYPTGEQLQSGLSGKYCPPEAAFSTSPVDETMSSYGVASLLYQAIHKQSPTSTHNAPLAIKPIPSIYQILRLCLSDAEDRLPLCRLRDALVETRKRYGNVKRTEWEIASQTTVGLSVHRLQNEDHYGIKHLDRFDSSVIALAAIADGMGGMNQGKVASQIAITTLLESAMPQSKQMSEWAKWLESAVQQANEQVSSQVQGGGTTLSVALAVDRNLYIAHIGDSRIFLIRNQILCQLSEDHSVTASRLANGQISYEDSLDDPDRNQLTRSLGDRRMLSEGYIHTLSRYGDLTLSIQEGDILLLCSDGVWDELNAENPAENSLACQMIEFFQPDRSLREAVHQTIEAVLKAGAHDNATLLALRCHFSEQS